jgi:hypothetical protein
MLSQLFEGTWFIGKLSPKFGEIGAELVKISLLFEM